MWIDKEYAQARYNICKSCNNFIPAVHLCRQCGCYMKLKVKLISAECLLKKWGKYAVAKLDTVKKKLIKTNKYTIKVQDINGNVKKY